MGDPFYARLWNDLIELEGKVKAGALSPADIAALGELLDRASLFFPNHGIDARPLKELSTCRQGWCAGGSGPDARTVAKVLELAIQRCDRERALETDQEAAAKELEKYR